MNNKKTIISVAAVIAVAAAIFGIATAHKKTDTAVDTTVAMPTTTTTSDSPSVPTPTPVADKPSTAPSSSTYKDGAYTAVGSYNSPGGPDQIGVTLTLKNDIVTAVSINPMPGDRESKQYQAKFASGYQSLVLGKDISSVKLSAVSGSSLTPIGFNDAITKIKAQAKA